MTPEGGYTKMIRVSVLSWIAVLELTAACNGLGSGRVSSKASLIRSACSCLMTVMPTKVILSAKGVLSWASCLLVPAQMHAVPDRTCQAEKQNLCSESFSFHGNKSELTRFLALGAVG